MFTAASQQPGSTPEQLVSESIASADSIEAIETEWQTLWTACRARPFQSPAWLLPWWRHIGRGRLACIAVRNRARGLLGFAPLYVFDDERGARHLFPLGIATTDYLDVLALPGHEDAVLQAMASHAEEHSGDWDVIEAPQLHEGALLLRCRWPPSWRRELAGCEPNPVIPLSSPLPASMDANLAYARRRLARTGHVEYLDARDAGVDELLDALARLHSSRWSARGEPGVLAAEGVLDWHRESAPRLLAQGLLRLLALRFDGKLIAVLYGIVDAPHLERRRWYSYIGGFDPAFAPLSPGTLILGHAIDRARAEGMTHFDCLRGAESYKYRWGAIDQPMFALRVTRSARPA